MKKYLMVCGMQYADKNKAQAAVKTLLKGMDRSIFESETEIKNFLNDVSDQVAQLYPRHKKIELDLFYPGMHKTDLYLIDVPVTSGIDIRFYQFEP